MHGVHQGTLNIQLTPAWNKVLLFSKQNGLFVGGGSSCIGIWKSRLTGLRWTCVITEETPVYCSKPVKRASHLTKNPARGSTLLSSFMCIFKKNRQFLATIKGSFFSLWTHFFFIFAAIASELIVPKKTRRNIDLMQIERLLISINWISSNNERNEPHHEKEHVKISNTAKFQSCRPNTRGMADIWKTRK